VEPRPEGGFQGISFLPRKGEESHDGFSVRTRAGCDDATRALARVIKTGSARKRADDERAKVTE